MTIVHLFPPKATHQPPRQTVRAVVLGTNEIASAVAVYLSRWGCRVVMSHDPMPPVIRRGMSFHDALYGELVPLEGVWGINCDHSLEIMEELTHGSRVIVTRLGLSHLLPVGGFGLIVDARMHKADTMPMLRYLAPVTIGLGPGFIAQVNCDVAIETHPDFIGQILTEGATMLADHIPTSLGTLKHERFVYSSIAGRWSTPLDVGARVYKDLTLGKLGSCEVLAPQDGFLRGIARDGTEVPASVKLVEIDPRGRNAQWTGLDHRAKSIAEATLNAYLQNIKTAATLSLG